MTRAVIREVGRKRKTAENVDNSEYIELNGPNDTAFPQSDQHPPKM